jgi:cobalt-zinc-cadmium efflux system membrane fusion protein
VVKEARKALGERVERDETVAVVESNESLQSYELRSPIGGIVAGRHAVAGEFLAAGEALYAIEDPSLLWAELDIHRQDFARLRVGQRVELALRPHEPPVSSSLLYLAPVVDVDTQTAAARVELPNPDGSLRPGQHLEAKIQIEETPVPLAVRESALQPFRDWTVVFVREGKVFEVRPLTLGRRDGEFAEVLEGLDPGREVVVEGAFLLRAELGKSGATHDH